MPHSRPEKTICPADHEHDAKTTCYNEHRCRCDRCRIKHNAKARAVAARIRNGTAQRYVPIAAVQKHIRELMAGGWRYSDIAKVAGVATPTVSRIGRGAVQRVTEETADAILGTLPTMRHRGDPPALVSAIGARRRLQALMAVGWNLRSLMRHVDRSPSQAWWFMTSDWMTPENAQLISDLYDRLWDQRPPQATAGEIVTMQRSIRHAKRRGWVGPLHWDDIDTDDAPPALEESEQPKTAPSLVENAAWLLDSGESPEHVVQQLGVSPGAIAKSASRHNRADVATHFWSLEKGKRAA